MKRILLALLSIIITAQISSAQFGNVYGYSTGSEEGYGIELAPDGGFVVGGRTNSIGNGNLDYYVIKFDKHGKKLWDKAVGTDKYELLWSIRTTHDNGVLLAGFSGVQYSGTESALMYKLDSLGNTVWTKDIDYPKADHAHWLAETKDGGYYFAGHTDSKNDPSGDMWCGKLDSARNLVWEKTFDNGSGEHVHAATITNDNGMLLLGHCSVSGYEKFWAVRVDSLGNEKWQHIYSSSATMHDSPYYIQNTRTGGFAFFGGTSGNTGTASQAWLVVVDSSGKKIFDKHYGTGETWGWSGRQTTDGGFVIAGYTSVGVPGQYGVLVIKTDSLGTVQWQKTYGGSADDEGYNIVQRGNNYIVCGYTTSFCESGISTDEDVWVIYTDLQGNVVDTLGPLTAPIQLAAATPVAPLDKATNVSTTPTLQWTTVPNAKSFEVQVSHDPGFEAPIIDRSGVVKDSAGVSGLANSATYYWRVRGVVDTTHGPWSDAWSFTVMPLTGVSDAAPPTQPQLDEIYPNPFVDVATLHVQLPTSYDHTSTTLKMYDVLGRVVADLTPKLFSGASIELRSENLAAGSYTVVLESAGMKMVRGVQVLK